jgi:hypothetical protein
MGERLERSHVDSLRQLDEHEHIISQERYVAFCDILGFSNRILQSFDETLQLYDTFASFWIDLGIENVETCIYSDAVLITSESLGSLITAVNTLWFCAQTHFFIIRGAIVKGRYWERRIGNSLFVASDALVRAVKIEQSIGFPMVALADDIEIPLEFWIPRFRDGPIAAPLLHFRDRNIVNPFGIMWFASAKGRISRMRDDSPANVDKYEWLLALHRAIEAQHDLVPQDVIDRCLALGFIAERPASS